MTAGEQDSFEERLRRSIEAYHEVALVYAAVTLGLPDKLATGPATAEQLAAVLGLSAPHLHRFMRGLCTIGLCEERVDGTFALTAAGTCLTSHSPARLAEKVQIVVGQYWSPWAELISTLETGKPSFDRVFGTNVSDWRREHPKQGALFASYLAKETRADIETILTSLDVSESDTVAEFDGANAALLADVPPRADLYLLKGVLQNYDDEAAAVILRYCREAMKDGARLVIVERLMPEIALDDPAAIMLDLHMMAITGGRARSLADFKALLAEAGLMLANATSTSSGLAVITASP